MAKLLSKLDLENVPTETEAIGEQQPDVQEVSYPEEALTAELLSAWEAEKNVYCYLFDGTVLSVLHQDTVYRN